MGNIFCRMQVLEKLLSIVHFIPYCTDLEIRFPLLRLIVKNMLIDIFYKNPFTNRFCFAIINSNKKRKELMIMKIIYAYAEPDDIDELIFAGEVTVPSER